jgi:DNA-binding NtrC family response regulator
VYKTAKQIDPDLNVIVITGYPDSEILDRILQVCPVTVLKKPLKIEQLYQTVKILGHNRPSRELEQKTIPLSNPGPEKRKGSSFWTRLKSPLLERSDSIGYSRDKRPDCV